MLEQLKNIGWGFMGMAICALACVLLLGIIWALECLIAATQAHPVIAGPIILVAVAWVLGLTYRRRA